MVIFDDYPILQYIFAADFFDIILNCNAKHNIYAKLLSL